MASSPTRRDIVMAGAALSLSAGGTRSQAAPDGAITRDPTSPTIAVGTVSEVPTSPENFRGMGTPVRDVLVSNGRDVVRTDAQGRFRLPIEPQQTVFLIKPSGYQVPLDPSTHLPRFSYVYDPEGTPASLHFRYEGLAPTGPLPASIDFQLVKVAEPEAFDVVLLADPQPQNDLEIAFVRDAVISNLIGTSAALGITCGDIAFDDLSKYGRINEIVGRVGIPWWNLGGNHDLNREALDARRSRDTYKRVFGAPHYAFEHGKVLFVMLDNVEYAGAEKARAGAREPYRGFISADQLAFVANLMAATPKDRLVVFAMHIPLKTYLGSEPARSTVNASDFLKLIGGRPTVSFSGHTHTTEHHYLGAEAGFTGEAPHHHHVLTAVSGSWWSGPRDHRGIACADAYDGSPNGHHMLSIDGASYRTRYVAAEGPPQQLRISLERQGNPGGGKSELNAPMVEVLRSPIASADVAQARVVVNVFDGGPKSAVMLTFAGGQPVEMSPVARADPFFVQVFDRHRETFKPWVTPQKSSHLWEAALPVGLRAGAYTISVAVTDEYGRRHAGSMVLEIV